MDLEGLRELLRKTLVVGVVKRSGKNSTGDFPPSLTTVLRAF